MSVIKAKKVRRRLSRREFLVAMGVAGGGLALGIKLGIPAVRLGVARGLADSAGMPESFDAPADAWFEITADNHVRLYVPKVEMGQGIHTAFAQIAAEELEITWDQIEVRHLPTQQAVDGQQGSGVTSSSTSVAILFTPLREAAATMRVMLQREAARFWGVPTESTYAENGEIAQVNAPEMRLTYGEIAAAVTDWELPESIPALKAARDFRYIGKSQPRVDLPDKISGKAIYGYDMRLPEMLYGAVARPPQIGAELLSAGPGTALEQPGVVQVVLDQGFAGVVAESRLQARSALGALNLTWSSPKRWQQAELEALVTVGEGDGTVIQREGDNVEDFFQGSGSLQAAYRTPFAAHAHLEPQAALARVSEEVVEIWTSTQGPWSVQKDVAEALGIEENLVQVYTTYLGGAFGRRVGTEVAVEAARLSAAAGRPVHVGWDRQEEFRNGFLRPPTHSILRGTLDTDGSIIAMEHQQASGDVAFPFLPGFLTLVMGADFAAWRGATIPYSVPNRETIAWRTKIPVPTGWWRGLGLLANTFALESFIDELAFSAGADPLEFRLRHRPVGEKGARYLKLLETVAERAGWGQPLQAGRALGLAMVDDIGTLVAEIAEISIEAGKIRVHKVTAAVDCGLVVNPDGVIAQTQGAIMMGLSATLKERIEIRDGQVTAANFDRYPLLTMAEAPDIDVILVESGTSPSGIGEPPIGPIPAAVANAVFALTGERLRTLPLSLASSNNN